jgi:fumarylacetoacetase
VSPWVITIEVLEPFRVETEIQNPSVLPYLQEKKRLNFDVQLEIILQAKGLEEMVISRSNFKNMY